MSETSESRWFKILVFVFSGFFVGFSIANIIYYERLRRSNNNVLTKTESTSMLWINIILLVIAVFIFLWSIWRLIFTKTKRQEYKQKAINYINDTNSGVVDSSNPSYQGNVPGVTKSSVSSDKNGQGSSDKKSDIFE